MLELSCLNWVQLIKKEKMPSGAKLTALYLSTFMNSEQNIAWPSQSRIAYETGQSEPTVRKWLAYLEEKNWIKIIRSSQEVLSGHQKYHHNKYLVSIPEQRVNSLLSDMSRGKTVDEQRVNESRAEGKPFTLNYNKNNNRNRGTLSFTPPTRKQVALYCKERGNSVDPQRFIDHYETTGWMRGKNKIKDWKACVRTWERQSKDEPQLSDGAI